MKHFLIIVNSFKDANLRLTGEIKSYIEERGGSCTYYISNGEDEDAAAPKPEQIPAETQGVIVLRGGEQRALGAGSADGQPVYDRAAHDAGWVRHQGRRAGGAQDCL